MTGGTVARRYARALYELACEEARVAEIGAALAEIAEAISGLEPGTLAPGLLGRDVREKLVEALGKEMADEPTLAKFLGVVAEADRLQQLPAMHEWYRGLEDRAAGRVRASIESAVELDAEELGGIKKKFGDLAAREIVPELSVNEELIGGVTVELEGRVYDGSVRSRLARLAADMAGES